MKTFKNIGHVSVPRYPRLDRFILEVASGTRTMYDHGCGYGAWTAYVAEMLDAKAAVFDPDADALEYTRRLLGKRCVEFGGPFDLILCFAVLELLSEAEQRALLAELLGKLHGTIIVQYNVYNPIAPRWLAIRFLKGDPRAWHEVHRFHRSYLTQRDVERLFKSSGFVIIDRCAPALESHLPFYINRMLAPMVPLLFQSTVYYALRKASDDLAVQHQIGSTDHHETLYEPVIPR